MAVRVSCDYRRAPCILIDIADSLALQIYFFPPPRFPNPLSRSTSRPFCSASFPPPSLFLFSPFLSLSLSALRCYGNESQFPPRPEPVTVPTEMQDNAIGWVFSLSLSLSPQIRDPGVCFAHAGTRWLSRRPLGYSQRVDHVTYDKHSESSAPIPKQFIEQPRHRRRTQFCSFHPL